MVNRRSISFISSKLNASNALKALKDPLNAYRQYRIYSRPFPKEELSRRTGEPMERIEEYRMEYRESPVWSEFQENVREEKESGSSWSGDAGSMGAETELLYVLVRSLKPRRIVETGVSAGRSTSFLLEALDRNGDVQLRSIDLPIYEDDELPYEGFRSFIPEGKTSGWAIPSRLKDGWRLYEGKSSEYLEDVLAEWEEIDLFIHDSAHEYDVMMWEYTTAWPHIKPGGFLASHDVFEDVLRDHMSRNPFKEFVREHSVDPIYYENMGLVPK